MFLEEQRFASHWAELSQPVKALWRSQRARWLLWLSLRCPPAEPPQPFRIWLCRRFRLPLPLTSRNCRCRHRLDKFGHHRAACSKVGVLGKGFPLECAAAQMCREAGGRVSTNVFVRDLDLAAFNALDNRRVEVIVDGLPLWHGAQLAIDTTFVSPLRGDCSPRQSEGCVVVSHAMRLKLSRSLSWRLARCRALRLCLRHMRC